MKILFINYRYIVCLGRFAFTTHKRSSLLLFLIKIFLLLGPLTPALTVRSTRKVN